jgi:bacterioferritin-associated ferredoxin
MMLCMCRGVTEGEILDAIRRGAFSLEKIARRCDGAGTDCGSCRADIQAHLDACRQEKTAA